MQAHIIAYQTTLPPGLLLLASSIAQVPLYGLPYQGVFIPPYKAHCHGTDTSLDPKQKTNFLQPRELPEYLYK